MDQETENFSKILADKRIDPEELPEAEVAKAENGAVYLKTSHKGKTDEDEAEGKLTVDVYQTPESIVVESAIAGVRPEDLDIEVSVDSITIRGSRHRERNVKEEDYFYRECYWGKFARSIVLPQEVDPESASVTFKNGVLTVTLPKLQRQKSKKLKVKSE